MAAGSNNCRDAVLKLICCTLLLLAEVGRVQGRRMPWQSWRVEGEIIDAWGRRAGAGDLEVVVHAGRHLLQTSAQYCVAASGDDAEKLQNALDWACGPQGSGGGVDCSAILQSGSCYQPDTLQAHASYAFNYYYVQQSGATGSCDFDGLATSTTTDPSSGSCVYPSLSSGVSSSPTSSNFTSSPVNSTFGSPISSSPSNAALGSALSWAEVRWPLLLLALVAAGLQL